MWHINSQKYIHNSSGFLVVCLSRHFVAVGDEARVEHVDGVLFGVGTVGGAGEGRNEVALGPRVGRLVDVVGARLEGQRLLSVAVADQTEDGHQQQHAADDEQTERQHRLGHGRRRCCQVQKVGHLARKTLNHLRKITSH